MSKLNKTFEAAVADSKKLPERPSNDVLLQLYALYKQATDGDVEAVRLTEWDARITPFLHQ